MHREVLPEVEQCDQEALGQLQFVGAAPADGANTSGAEQEAPTGTVPLGFEIGQQGLELVRGEADEALEGTRPAFQRLGTQHAENLPCLHPISQQVFRQCLELCSPQSAVPLHGRQRSHTG